jgi:hypothetical protein
MSQTSVRRQKPSKVHARKSSNNFSAAYFRKFYLNPATRVVTASEMRSRAALIAAILRQAQIPIRSILDAGCGMGLLRRSGWIAGSVVDYAPRKAADLCICYDVLQYLTDADAARAISNLSSLTWSALYVSALTAEDWRDNCDRTRTDRAVHLRPGAWYRRRLRKSFRYIGFGIWLRKGVTAILWDMERA